MSARGPSEGLFSPAMLGFDPEPHHPSAFIPHLGDEVIGLVQGSTVWVFRRMTWEFKDLLS